MCNEMQQAYFLFEKEAIILTWSKGGTDGRGNAPNCHRPQENGNIVRGIVHEQGHSGSPPLRIAVPVHNCTPAVNRVYQLPIGHRPVCDAIHLSLEQKNFYFPFRKKLF